VALAISENCSLWLMGNKKPLKILFYKGFIAVAR
jgi:hypothetical protein